MSTVKNPGAAVGQYAGLPGSFSLRVNKASAITINRGLVCRVDTGTSPDSLAQAAATALLAGPFVGIPVETRGDGFTTFSIRCNDVVYLRADGDIEPYKYVTTSDTTAGEVIAGTVTADNQIIGFCLGTVETWNTGAPAAAADGDLVAVYVPIHGAGKI